MLEVFRLQKTRQYIIGFLGCQRLEWRDAQAGWGGAISQLKIYCKLTNEAKLNKILLLKEYIT
jgi:hypothetical protein